MKKVMRMKPVMPALRLSHSPDDDPDEHQERSFVTKKVGRNARGRGGARITKKEEDVRVQVGCTYHRVVPGDDAEEPDGNPVGHPRKIRCRIEAMKSNIAYKFELMPTREQKRILAQAAGCRRFV